MAGLVSIVWNRVERRPRLFWRLLALVLVIVVLTAIVQAVFFGLLIASLGLQMPPGGDLRELTGGLPAWTTSVSVVLSGLASVVAVWFVGRFLDRRRFADFGWHVDGRWLGDCLFGLALGALLMTFIFVVELAAGWLTVTAAFAASPTGDPFVVGFVLAVATWLAIGIYEELLSRGYLIVNLSEGLNYRSLGARWAIVVAWVISSVIFGLLHAVNPNASAASTLNIVVAGLLLGTGFVLTGELAIPIGLHITWNLFQGSVYGFPVSGSEMTRSSSVLTIVQGGPPVWTGGAFGPEAGMLGTLASLLGIVLVVLWVRWRHGRLALYDPLAVREDRRPGRAG